MYTTYLEHGHTDTNNRLWGWLSLNLCTGHGMMRIIKSAGGLSHCKGVDELQQAIFLLWTYITGTMCKMQELTAVNMKSSDQHHYACLSMFTWDKDGLLKVINYIEQHNPMQHVLFCPNTLHTIANAKTVSSFVNADNTQAIGEAILHSMGGKVVTEIFSKKGKKIIEIKFHANLRSAAILSLVLDFILSGSTLSPFDHIHCLIGLLVFYRCVHKWSHIAIILQIWKIMVRTTASPYSVWLLNGYIQTSCFGQCQFNSHTYRLISVVILIILSYAQTLLLCYSSLHLEFSW